MVFDGEPSIVMPPLENVFRPWPLNPRPSKHNQFVRGSSGLSIAEIFVQTASAVQEFEFTRFLWPSLDDIGLSPNDLQNVSSVICTWYRQTYVLTRRLRTHHRQTRITTRAGLLLNASSANSRRRHRKQDRDGIMDDDSNTSKRR